MSAIVFHVVIEHGNDLHFHVDFDTWIGTPKGLKSGMITDAAVLSNRKNQLHTTF